MKSYFHQPRNIPYVFETIPERVQKLAEEKPDKIAMVMYHSKEERYQITRKELYDRSFKFARALLKVGVKKGDRVAYCVSNCIDWMVYDVGIMMAGGVSVHLLLGAADIKAALAGCTVIILDAKERWDDLLSVAKIHPGGKITSDACPSLKLGIAVSSDSQPVNALLASELMAEIDAQDPDSFLKFPVVDPEDTAFITQTSGTTGTPKKVQHSHFNILNCTVAHCDGTGFTCDDVLYSSRPMAYMGGYPSGYLKSGVIFVSGDTIFLNEPQHFETTVDIWKKESCSVIGMAPHNLKDLRDFSFRIRMIASGGDLLTREMINHSFIFADKMLVVYGSTEACLITYMIFTKSNIEHHLQGMLGRPAQGVEVKIVNDQNETVQLGETGMLSVRSAWVSKGYDDGGLSCPLKNGWFRTTDVCVMLPGGDLLMKGRKSDFIIKGTVNLPIQLIESYIDRHPDVQKVVVVGVPDPSCGEDVCACVQLFPGRKFDSGELRKFCENNMQYKSSFDWVTMVPNYFLQFDDFPMTESGKLDKKKIKELATELVNIVQSKKKELYDKALKFAQVLHKLGIRKGDRVAYCVSNCIDWMSYDVGIMMAGGVSVHLLMGSADVKITLSGCSMIILDSKERWRDFLGVAEIHPGGKITCDACSSLKLAMAVIPESRPANALLASELMAEIEDRNGSDFSQLPVLDPEDTALVNQTSGTTGIPKKVCQSHFNIVNSFATYSIISDISSDDVCYTNRPMAYAGGYPWFYIGIGTTTVTGDVRFLNDPVNNDFVVSIWKKEGCNIVFMLPQSIKYLHDYGFRTKLIISGGDMITEEMIRHSFVFSDAFALIYGSTETFLNTHKIFTQENISEHRQGMLGFNFPGMEAQIIDEKEEVVEMGTVGTLCLRSAWNTKGYDGNQVAPLNNGWFHSNDLCYIQPDCKLLMKGRKSGFIIKGTVNVSIQLIEDYVGSHPDVEQVVVVGVPDSRFGEDICACVQIATGRTFDKDALRAHCEKKMSSKSSLDWIIVIQSKELLLDIFFWHRLIFCRSLSSQSCRPKNRTEIKLKTWQFNV